jgi:signal transduction histidine kinase/CheY-like chemotaxis protein
VRLRRFRSRIMLAAMLPVALVVLVLVAVFWLAGTADNEKAHSQGARSLVRQVSAASEYGLFSGNIDHLRTVANGALRESDVRSVAILDANGAMLVQVGLPGYTLSSLGDRRGVPDRILANGDDLLSQTIAASQVKLDDLYQSKTGEAAAAPNILGQVLIEFSHQTVLRRELELFLLALALGMLGLSVGGLLAGRLGQRVIEPVARVSQMIERIGSGELTARATVLPDDPLQTLQLGLNQMAESLESSRKDLEQRIALATRALREKKEEAETATLAKSRFLAAASHDLRQPTHALGMFVARLRQLEHNTETRNLVANLELALQAMRDLLDGLLDISRLDAGVVQVQVQAFALNDILDQLKAELTLTATGKGLRLRVRPTRLWCLSDPVLLHRILLNLLGNALRYTRTGGVLLACRVVAGGKTARIEVWDSGIGIATEHQRAVFGEFYQVGNLERDRDKGLGLGLNIVQRTAQLLGHRLQLWSRPGVGSRFMVEVPMASPAATAERQSPPRAESFDDLAAWVVQVIEDDALARAGLASLLASWGARVVEAENLSVALRQAQQGPLPDVIISDYRLRDGENGIDAIARLRSAAGQAIPAFLISGDTDPTLLLAAKDAGLILLHKPVRPAKLRSLIRRLASHAQIGDDALP